MATIILQKGRDRRLVGGHPWIYGGEIDRIVGEPRDGDVVDITDAREHFMGRGLINRRSRIVVRRFTAGNVQLDRDFFRGRLAQALAARAGLGGTFRVVFSEGDQLPGLIVDKYEDHLVIQALTLGIDQRKAELVELAAELLKPRAIVERSDVHSRRLEGLAESKGVLRGETDGKVTIELPIAGGLRFAVDLLEDQKTGFFLDQRDNYDAVARLARGRRVLDCFSYHGGFALAAARAGARTVTAVESSEAAIERTRHNARLNGIAPDIELVCANVFDTLNAYDTAHREFDLIVLDPPSFTRTKDSVDGALRGYKEINLRALRMLPPGGVLATFSCSHHIGADLFRDMIVAAAADARRTVRLLRVLTQSADHPILPAVPETEYLRGLLLQVV